MLGFVSYFMIKNTAIGFWARSSLLCDRMYRVIIEMKTTSPPRPRRAPLKGSAYLTMRRNNGVLCEVCTYWPNAVGVAVRALDGDEEDGVRSRRVLVHVGAARRALSVAGPHQSLHLRRSFTHYRSHLRDVESVQLLAPSHTSFNIEALTRDLFRTRRRRPLHRPD